MTETKKVLFCNFDSNITNAPTKNNLSIKHILNLSTDGGIIRPFYKQENIFKVLLTEEEYETYQLSFAGLEYTSHKIIPFEYIDLVTKKPVLRILIVDSENCLKEYEPANGTLLDYEIYFNSIPQSVLHNNELYLFDNALNIYSFTDNLKPTMLTNTIKVCYVKFYKELIYFRVEGNSNTIFVAQNKSFADLVKEDTLPAETLVIDENYGAFQDVLICDNYVYIVQDYGIAKIEKYKDETIFTYFKSDSKICDETAKSINDYIAFFSTGGICRFDGNRITVICETLFNSLGDSAVAEVFNNKYYLATNLNHQGVANNVLIEIDISKQSANIMSSSSGEVVELVAVQLWSKYLLQVMSKNLNARNTTAVINQNTNSYGATKTVEFNKLYLDTMLVKQIQNIFIDVDGEVTFEITSNFGDKIAHTSTGSFNLSNLFLRGVYFNLKIYSLSNFTVDSIYIEYTGVNNA